MKTEIHQLSEKMFLKIKSGTMNNVQNNNHLHINCFSNKHLVHTIERIKDMY